MLRQHHLNTRMLNRIVSVNVTSVPPYREASRYEYDSIDKQDWPHLTLRSAPRWSSTFIFGSDDVQAKKTIAIEQGYSSAKAKSQIKIAELLMSDTSLSLVYMIDSIGIPKHSDLEPDYLLVKRNGKSSQIAACTDSR